MDAVGQSAMRTLITDLEGGTLMTTLDRLCALAFVMTTLLASRLRAAGRDGTSPPTRPRSWP